MTLEPTATVPESRPFGASEFADRLARLTAVLRARGVELMVVDQVEHLGYVTGYTPSAATYQPAVVTADGEVVSIVRQLDEPTFLAQSWVRDYATFRDWDDPVSLLVDVIRERGWEEAVIGQELDSHFLLVSRYLAIKAGLPRARLVDFSEVLWDLRLCKSEQELAYHERAAAIADSAFARGAAVAGPGVKEREVAAEVYATAIREGADNTRVALMASGGRTAELHGHLGQHVLAAGDHVHLELVPHYHGYTSRVMRPISVGPPSDELSQTVAQLVAAQDAELAAMRPGAVARDVDAVLREEWRSRDLGEECPNISGYTVGFVGVPRTSDFTRTFSPAARWRLEEGMTFHMYASARGVSVSETIVVDAIGARRLSRLPRRLIEAGEVLWLHPGRP